MFLLTKYKLFVFQLAAAIGIGTAQTTAANNRIDETNRRVGTTESDITKLKSTDTAEAAKVAALEAKVGSPTTTGLCKDVADLKTSVGTPTTGLNKDVADLKTKVGDSASGLTKDVADNKAVVGAPAGSTGLYAFVKDTCTKVSFPFFRSVVN